MKYNYRNFFLHSIFISLLFLAIIPSLAVSTKGFQIETPLEAALLYFPSPPVMRCLNHSGIPEESRKALIHRKIKFSKDSELIQNVSIGINLKKSAKKEFALSGNIIVMGEIIKQEINIGDFFNSSKGEKISPEFLGGLGKILGLQRKIHTKDKIDNQVLDYSTFLRNTKGMIGNAKYELELFGEDRVIKQEVKYILKGKGKIGEDRISVVGKEATKDNYEIKELYGPVEVYTTVKVYD